MKIIPDKLIGYNAYRDGSTLLDGIKDVELSQIEGLSEATKGAGIAGEMEIPTLGLFGPMQITINFTGHTRDFYLLSATKTHALDFRGSQQILDAATGELKTTRIRVSVRCMPKSTSLGKLEPGASTENSLEMEVSYIKIMFDGEVMLEIDKLNFVAVFNGKDLLAQVREDVS